jgi:hypothetical protein
MAPRCHGVVGFATRALLVYLWAQHLWPIHIAGAGTSAMALGVGVAAANWAMPDDDPHVGRWSIVRAAYFGIVYATLLDDDERG